MAVLCEYLIIVVTRGNRVASFGFLLNVGRRRTSKRRWRYGGLLRVLPRGEGVGVLSRGWWGGGSGEFVPVFNTGEESCVPVLCVASELSVYILQAVGASASCLMHKKTHLLERTLEVWIFLERTRGINISWEDEDV